MQSKGKGRALIIASALLWGLAGVCVKSVTWGTMSIIATRSAVSLLMLLIAKRSLRVRFTKKNVLGGVATCLTGILYVEAIKLTTAGTAIVLQYVAPIFVFLYEVVFRARKVRLWEAALTVCVFFGIVLSFLDSIDMTRVIGNILALLSGVFFAGQIILMNDEKSGADDCVAIGNMLSFVVCLPFMFRDPGLQFTVTNIVWMLILSVFQYGLANLLFARGCKLVDSVECSMLLTIEPIFNPIPVALIRGERMGAVAVVGAAVVIVSVTLYSVLPGLRQKRSAGKPT